MGLRHEAPGGGWVILPAVAGSARPSFSIVVPTRNRGALLAHALSSVEDQTDRDFELIVSDNCSTDGTAEVIAGVEREQKVTVVRPPQALPMADHWNFALSHASGDWVLLLGDDDYFSRDLLSTLRSVIDKNDPTVLTWHCAVYHHNLDIPKSDLKYVPFYYDPSRMNKLDLMSWTGQTYALDAREQLSKLYAFQDVVAPSGHVSALRRDVIDRAVSWAGSLFHPPYPDFGCSATVLATAESMTHVDIPLHVLGRVPRLGALSYLLAPANQSEFNAALAAEYGSDDLYEGQPLQSSTLIATNITASLEHVRRLMPEPARQAAQFDWERYFIRCRLEITAMERAGFPMKDLTRQFDAALAEQPAWLRDAVTSKLEIRFPRLGDGLSRLKSAKAAHLVRRLVYSRRAAPDTFLDRADLPRWRSTIDGGSAGFSDIGQAAAYVDGLRVDAAGAAVVGA